MEPASPETERQLATFARAGLTAQQHSRLGNERSRAALEAAGLPRSTLSAMLEPSRRHIDADLRWLHASGAHLVGCDTPAYPPLLRESPDAPAALYVLGEPGVLREPQVAMVGSRSATAGGLDTARRFARWFAQAGLGITSGMALGIDAACHEGALDGGGFTVAVLGCGLAHTYPRQHAALARRIAANGAVVSEFPPDTAPRRELFPQRNRLIAGLSAGTVVVEAAIDSGSLITARLAGVAGREVFAIPGSIHNPMSRGCHELIRQGAKLIERPEEVLNELKISLSSQLLASAPTPARDACELDKGYKILLDALAFEPAGVDTLIERTGLNSESIASMLLVLELDGHVAPHPGGRYSRSNA
jgi:DNA processing protein